MQQPFFIACWQIPCRKNSLSSHASIRPAVPRTVSQQAAPPHLPQAVLPARETRLLLPLLYAVGDDTLLVGPVHHGVDVLHRG